MSDVPARRSHAGLGGCGKLANLKHALPSVKELLGGRTQPRLRCPLAAAVARGAGGRFDNHGRRQAGQRQAEQERDLHIGMIEGPAAQGALEQLRLTPLLQEGGQAWIGEGWHLHPQSPPGDSDR